MRCYFVRHGQSTNNLLYEDTGSTEGRSDDPPLTLLGKKQAKKAGIYFLQGTDPGDDIKANRGLGITHIYSSLMVRAINTGQEISQAVGLPLIGWKDLHEQGGVFFEKIENRERIGLPGKHKEDLLSLFPELKFFEEPDPNGWWNRPHETTEEARQRGKNVLAQLLERHGGTEDRVVLVSHGAFYACFMSAVLNLQEPDNYWFVLNNTGITRVDFLDKYTYLVYQNYLGFLKKEQIS
jgi:2,3-bisphosphoglycerate-dependent phosphoglycerate mutase